MLTRHRKILILVAAVTLVGGGLVGWEWSWRPAPPRAVFRPSDASNSPQGFTGDGRVFLTHGPTGTVLWDTETWTPRTTWPLLACDVWDTTRHGTTAIGVHGYDEKKARIVTVDIASGVVQNQVEVAWPRVWHLKFTDDDRVARLVLSDWQDQIHQSVVWDLTTGSLTTRPLSGPTGPTWRHTPTAVSPDGMTAAFVNYPNGGIQLWDVAQDRAIGGLLRTPTKQYEIWMGVDFSPDGRTLFVARSDGRIEVWDLANPRLVRTLDVHARSFHAASFQTSHDGRTLISRGLASPSTSSWASDVNRMIQRQFGLPATESAEVVVIDLDTGQVLARWPGAMNPTLSPDGRTVVTMEADRSFAVRDLPTASDQPTTARVQP